MPFSIVILTKDEEQNIQACLDSVAWCDDVVVLDSYSQDATCDIARANGARVFQRKFDNFAGQRNFALDSIDFKYGWLFHLDADERFNDELRRECERVIAKDEHSGYFVPNRIIFFGKWIKHSTQYPHPQVRLLKRGEIRFAVAGHGQREDQAERGIGHIHVAYDHYNFSKGIADWVEKHNRYSTDEARAIVQARQADSAVPQIAVESSTTQRRKRLKNLHARMPLRHLVKFTYLYIFRLGFLDGKAGFAYCTLQSFYDYLIVLKVRELQDAHLAARVTGKV